MESELSAKQTAQPSSSPAREETLLFPRVKHMGLILPFWGMQSSHLHHLTESDAGERASQSKETAFLYKFGNLEFLEKWYSLCYKTSLLVQPPSAQQEI